ncbi:MAG: hypothetical protein CMO55_21985 [Verrucomicrobiales bacterium]|nr:hypothetical protein [Verrucomicrobiales bacterium]
MIDPKTEALCESIRDIFSCTKIPIDPKVIAKKEGIILAPDDYGPGFDGRIEFLLPERKFVIYYQDSYLHVPEVRIRFSLAHELGHFYLDHHREALCQGISHDSEQALMSDREREREADCFAASLLIPRREIKQRTGDKGFMDMKQIVELADDLNVSIPAAAIRYCGYTEENCAIILSKDGIISCHIPSDGMRDFGLSFMRSGDRVPRGSSAEKLIEFGNYREIRGESSTTDTWYQRGYDSQPLYEDSISLGYDGRVLTMLSV